MTHRITSDQRIVIKSAVENVIGDYQGGDYLSIELDGTIEFNGAATVWEDENVGDVLLGRGASAPDLVQVNSGTIYLPGFDGVNTTEQLFASIEIPHSYKQGSNLIFHVHWAPVNADVGNVLWQLTYSITEDGDAQSAETTIEIQQAAPGVAWEQNRADFPAINGAALLIENQIDFRFFRDPSDDDDTYGSDAVVKTVGFHYEKDTVGSRQITTK